MNRFSPLRIFLIQPIHTQVSLCVVLACSELRSVDHKRRKEIKQESSVHD
jgi:hypothetical protein